MKTTLKVESVTKSFDGVRVADSVSFSVESGQIAVIVGASGSGKTTILRCIAGFLVNLLSTKHRTTIKLV